ncbi:2788_t:CDS:2, partial [Acaulospora colombiana]
MSNAGASQLTSGSGGSASAGRSWTKISSITSPYIDVNAQDWLGRTVLHLACSATDPAALEFARLLLAHPQIQVNSYDQESHWTALHRALYAGNIAVAVLLLQRSDTDMFLKDYEGYTPFDLYNSTVNGTNPSTIITDRPMAELYTWGSNRNATLGLGDSDDRALPEQVVIRRPEGQRTNNLHESLQTVSISDVSMSKLHTVVITTESRANIRSCGFTGSGRLGPGATTSSHTQFSLLCPHGSFPHTITAVALGQDHTLALTSSGE